MLDDSKDVFIAAQAPEWAARFPAASPAALDLLDRMLQFNPANRITVAQALQHPYLAQLHEEAAEPAAPGAPQARGACRASVSGWSRLWGLGVDNEPSPQPRCARGPASRRV